MKEQVIQNFDVFPAKVVIEVDGNQQQLDRVRVRTDGPDIEVWAESRTYPHQPELVYTAPIDEIIENSISAHYPVSQQHATLITSNGVVAVQKSNGCGCGSRLYNIPQTRYQQQAENSQLMSALRGHFPDARF